MTSVDWLLAEYTALSIKDTPGSGRAVFADQELKHDTALLTTTAEQSPLVHVILRPYRKEVCAQCFSYDRGREWKIRNAAHGTVFCSEHCQEKWMQSHDALMLEASIAIETFIKSSLRRQRAIDDDEPSDASMHHEPGADTTVYTQTIWESMDSLAVELRHARTTSKLAKTHRTILSKAKDLTPDPDVLSYTLSGVLAAYRSQRSNDDLCQTSSRALLPSLFALADDQTVFLHTPTTASPLLDYTSSYLVLLAILPQSLLPLITSELLVNLASRASHNAFSIRPEGTTDGEQSGEFLGWGVWPEASFFNHSCRPNVRKERKGRFWSFSVDMNGNGDVINTGDQLCITYLGGDERDIDVDERRQRLLTQWGFRCQCGRCIEESGEKSGEKA